MQVRALISFVDESGRHSAGDVLEMSEGMAVRRIKAGLVQRVPEEPEMAMREAPELAITRKGRRY